jgi:hypothetical protein
MARFLGDNQMVAALRRRKMPVTPAHGSNPAHGTVIDSGTCGHNNRPNAYPVAPPIRQDGLTSPKDAKADRGKQHI